VTDDPEVEALRVEIDRIDQRLLQVLAERATVVLRVGERKKVVGLAVHDPRREQALLERLVAQAPVPLDRELVLTVFRTIVAECRRLEAGGPEG
jgi:chorismate mutase/prephenate dehydratase